MDKTKKHILKKHENNILGWNDSRYEKQNHTVGHLRATTTKNLKFFISLKDCSIKNFLTVFLSSKENLLRLKWELLNDFKKMFWLSAT